MGCGDSKEVQPDESVVNSTHFLEMRLIGKGGFGEVKAVTKTSGVDKDTQYAMKIYQKKNLLSHASGVKEVMWELSMLATLQSPWICNARYAFQDETHCYLVMDLALGGDLSYHRKAEKRFTEERVRIYLAQIYLALEYLHSRKVLHRDLKPANVILDADGFIKVTDMGISAHLNSNNICRQGSGTPGFMAPELYTTTREHSFPSDWWSYGVTAHHLLVGRAPFKRNAFKNKRSIKVKPSDLEKGAPTYPTPVLYFKDGTGASRDTRTTSRVENGDEGGEESGGEPGGDDESEEGEYRQSRSVEVSDECASFLEQLLQKNPANRLGAKSPLEVKHHSFFTGFDWSALKARTLPVPFVPDTTKVHINLSPDDIFNDAIGLDDEDDKKYVVPDEDKAKFTDYHLNTVLAPDKPPDGSAMFRERLRSAFPSMMFGSGLSQAFSSKKTMTRVSPPGGEGEAGDPDSQKKKGTEDTRDPAPVQAP